MVLSINTKGLDHLAYIKGKEGPSPRITTSCAGFASQLCGISLLHIGSSKEPPLWGRIFTIWEEAKLEKEGEGQKWG